MILKEFPDLQWLKAQANQRFLNRTRWDGKPLPNDGWPSVILNTKTAHTYRDNIKGPLSLFTNLRGNSTVKAGGKEMHIQEGFFGISNVQEEYTLEIHNPEQTETLNVHFGECFLKSAVTSLLSGGLDVDQSRGEIPSLYNRVSPLDQTASGILLELKSLNENTIMKEDELLFRLLQWVLKGEKEIQKAFAKLSAVKSSTQKEIGQRLLLATDYIYAYYNKPLSLEELAQTACLSKFHFLRLFKSTFGITPYQFINQVRVQHAKQLLAASQFPVNEIALQCGFINASTFSRMFYNQAGFYPSQLRAQN